MKTKRQKETYNRAMRKWNKKTQGFLREYESWDQYEIKLVQLNDKLSSVELAHILERSAHAISCKRYELRKKGYTVSKIKKVTDHLISTDSYYGPSNQLNKNNVKK